MRIVTFNVNGINPLVRRMPMRIPDKSQRYETGYDLTQSKLSQQQQQELARLEAFAEAEAEAEAEDELDAGVDADDDNEDLFEKQNRETLNAFVPASALRQSSSNNANTSAATVSSVTNNNHASDAASYPQRSAMQRAIQDPSIPTHAVNTLKELLDSFHADIICLQETKMFRHDLTHDVGCVDGYDGYFSFNKVTQRKGYSGVVTYIKKSSVTVLRAEEGFTGLLSSNIFGGCEELYKDFNVNELRELDSEGRCIITEHICRKYHTDIDDTSATNDDDTSTSTSTVRFLLFNVYLPNAGNEIRDDFKLRYYQALERRVDGILSANPSMHIIICGDVNTAHQRQDHCDPMGMTLKQADRPTQPFEERRSRQWLTHLLRPHGNFVDVYRYFYPNQTKRYTCWNTVTNARMGNFGKGHLKSMSILLRVNE
jgi:exonuclease III